MKGRPITGEEFERLLAKVVDVVSDESADAWKHLLRGLWWSGLRLGEALGLTWDNNPRAVSVDLSGRRPMLRIPAECEKGNRDRVLPIAPEFSELLLTVPEADRRGRVFRPWTKAAPNPSPEFVSKTIGRIGRKAGVVVNPCDAPSPDGHDAA